MTEGRADPEGNLGVDEVAPNLFVGGEPSGSVLEMFRTMDLRLVINLSESDANKGEGVIPPEGRDYVWLPLPDGVEMERTPQVHEAVQLALGVLRDGGRVLVHCREGYLRSVQFAGMLVEKATAADRIAAVAAVAKARLGIARHIDLKWHRPAPERWRVLRAAGMAVAAAAVIAIGVNAILVGGLPSGSRGPAAEGNPGHAFLRTRTSAAPNRGRHTVRVSPRRSAIAPARGNGSAALATGGAPGSLTPTFGNAQGTALSGRTAAPGHGASKGHGGPKAGNTKANHGGGGPALHGLGSSTFHGGSTHAAPRGRTIGPTSTGHGAKARASKAPSGRGRGKGPRSHPPRRGR